VSLPLYECEKCGHRNFVTADDLERERSELADRAVRRLKRKLPPDDGLKEPIRSFASTFSAVDVLRRMFHLK